MIARTYYDNPDEILREHEAKIVINDKIVDSNGKEIESCEPEWYLTWKGGCTSLGLCETMTLRWAKVEAALIIRLWLYRVDVVETNDIAFGYVWGHNWFKQRQRVYQLRGICLNTGEVIFSNKLWYTIDQAEKAMNDFGVSNGKQFEIIDIISLELGPWA